VKYLLILTLIPHKPLKEYYLFHFAAAEKYSRLGNLLKNRNLFPNSAGDWKVQDQGSGRFLCSEGCSLIPR
jgi:hypothetical protein